VGIAWSLAGRGNPLVDWLSKDDYDEFLGTLYTLPCDGGGSCTVSLRMVLQPDNRLRSPHRPLSATEDGDHGP